MKTTITIAVALFERLMAYPGPSSLSDRIETLCEYALKMGAWMSPEEAQEIADKRALELFGIQLKHKKKK